MTFTSPDRVRDVIHDFNTDGFEALYPKYKGGRSRTFTLPERREIKKIAKSKPAEHDLPFSTWSLARLADLLVAEGVVDDISYEGLRVLLREEGVSFPTRRPGRPRQAEPFRLRAAVSFIRWTNKRGLTRNLECPGRPRPLTSVLGGAGRGQLVQLSHGPQGCRIAPCRQTSPLPKRARQCQTFLRSWRA
ncbi:helix-turn-helix domain-containing protein [Streptomyces sp. NBC_00154]|nr:helix-turn-helix domain-containing protein [Streptomyces sp. NBC_00154]